MIIEGRDKALGTAWAVARWLAAALVVALALWPLLARADAVSVVPVGRAVGIKLFSMALWWWAPQTSTPARGWSIRPRPAG